MNLLFFVCCFVNTLSAQKNYRISYNKLADVVSYFKLTWINGEQKEEQVQSIRLQQNDVVQVEIVELNPLAFSTEIYVGMTEVSNNGTSPMATILAGFSGMGGPALRLLTSLAASPPNQIYSSRGDQDPMQLKRQELSVSVNNIYRDLSEILDLYLTYDEQMKVKYSRSLTKEQILNKLDSLNQKFDFSGLQERYEKLMSEREKLTALKESINLAEDDEMMLDLQFIENKLEDFQIDYIDQEGNLKLVDLSTDLIDVEIADFTLTHTFTVKSSSNYGEIYASNEYFLVFSEVRGDNPELYPIDFVKKISIPIQQAKAPYWVLTAQNFYPIGGINNYNIQVIYEDWDSGDSLLIQESSQSGGLVSFGTMLGYDFETEKSIMPSILFGAAISGVNKPQDNWSLSLALGAGLSFKKFPYLSINGGFGLTQTKVLKNEYFVNRPMLAPSNVDSYSNYEGLFTKKMKPSIFFGIGIRL